MTRLLTIGVLALMPVQVFAQAAPPPTPADVKPGSITCEDVPYPYPVSVPAVDAVRAGHPDGLHGRAARRASRTARLSCSSTG